MKGKGSFVFSIAMLVVLSILFLRACGSTDASTNAHIEQATQTIISVTAIPGYTNLVYIDNTGTVYYYETASGGYSQMAPYIINGHFCEYIDGEIIEVIPTVRIEESTN